jgi:hypothetical protein
MPRPSLADEHGIIVGFFVKLLVGLLLATLVVADGAAIFFAHLRADDAAATGASECAFVYKKSRGNLEQATEAGRSAALKKAPGVSVVRVEPNTLNGECTVVASEQASTLIVKRIGFLKKLGDAEATETAPAPTF